MAELDAFLEEQSEGLFDSTGEFTIAADRALEKLAASQLPEPDYWILKLAQFATASGVSNMKVDTRRGACRVILVLPRPLRLEHFSAGLNSIKPLGDPALEHLVTALRAIGGMTERSFGLCLRGPDFFDLLHWNGSELSTSRVETGSEKNLMILEVALPTGRALKSYANVTRAVRREGEAKVLLEKAFTVPFYLSIGGYSIGKFQRSSANLFSQIVYWGYQPSKDGIKLPRFLKKKGQRYPLVSAYWCLTYHYGIRHEAWNLTPDPSPRFHSSMILWLRDGVVIRREILNGPGSPYALELYIDVSDLPTDLGGLDCRKGEEFVERRNLVRGLLMDIANEASERVGAFTEVSGTPLEGWEANIVATKFLPLGAEAVYPERNKVSVKLAALPSFRERLVKVIQSGPVPLDELKLPPLL